MKRVKKIYLLINFTYLCLAPLSIAGDFHVKTEKTQNSLFLEWTAPSLDKIYGDFLSYHISYVPVAIGGISISELDQVEKTISVHSTLTSATLIGLDPNTEYEIKIAAVNQHGIGLSTSTSGGNYFR